MAILISRDGTQQHVKNLGWLLSNARLVDRFELTGQSPGSGYMVAHLADGRRFATSWASARLMHEFVHSHSWPHQPREYFGPMGGSKRSKPKKTVHVRAYTRSKAR